MENRMSITSCINHPEKEPVLVLHGWQLDFCNTNQVAAGLMSLFEYWHNVKVKMQAKKLKNQRDELDLIQYHTQDDLIDKTLYLTKTPACIRRAIEFLEQKKIITVCRNPNKRYKFDRTRHFIFHPEVVNNWLKNRGKKINDQQENNAHLEPKMDTVQVAEQPSPTTTPPKKPSVSVTFAKEKSLNPEKNTPEIIFDFALKDFSLSEQGNICKVLSHLDDTSLQQSILDEFNQAISGGKVKNVLAYLAALVERANRGKFFSTAQLAQQREPKIPLTCSTLSPPQAKKPHELFPVYSKWQVKQEKIKELIKLSDYMSFVLPVRAYQSDRIVFLRCPNIYSYNFFIKVKEQVSFLFSGEIKVYMG